MSKILLIEDDALLVRMYQKKLEMDGNEVHIALDGEQGITMIKELKPDLVLLDVMLPKKNGFDVLREAKSDETVKNIPIILLTNLGNDEEDISKGIALGAVAYLIKTNLVPSEVVTKIKEVLNSVKQTS